MQRIILAIIFLFVIPFFAYAANIDTTNKYARFLSTGTLINFGATNGNVTVTSTAVTGNAWSSAAGWINLAPTNGGVVNDGHGVLSGYAWGENTGWINFKPTNGGVTIDSSGSFSGYAWSESRGWIVFNCATDSSCGTLSHKVQTSWVPPTTTATTTTTTGGSTGSGWVNTVNSQIPQPVPPTPSEPSTPTTPDTPVTELPPSQTPEQPAVATPSQTPSTTQTGTTQPDAVPVNAGTANEGQLTTEGTNRGTDSVLSAQSSFQDNIFGFATKVSTGFSKLLSSAKHFFVNSTQKSGGAPSSSVLGSVTVLSIVVTGVIAFIILFVLSRIKSAFFQSIPSLFARMFSWLMGLIALLAIKRHTSEKSSDILSKETVTPVVDVPQIPTAPIVEVKKEEENISWNIQPQPVILPTNNTQEILQEVAVEQVVQKPEIIIADNLKKDISTIEAPKKEGIVKDSIISSRDDFMSLFMSKKPLEPSVSLEQKVETKVEAPKEAEVVVPELALQEIDEVLETPEVIPDAQPAVSVEIKETIPQEVVNNSPAPIPTLKNAENPKNRGYFQKTGAKIAQKMEQFSQKMSKKMHKIAKEVKPVDTTKKHTWNPRPPTGTD